MASASSPPPPAPDSPPRGVLTLSALLASGMDERLKLLKERVPAFEFEGKEARELAITALTHSSLSATRNGTELAKVGEACSKAVATKALYLAPGTHSGAQYNHAIALNFSKKSLSPIGRDLKLDELMRLGKGVPYVSDEMVSTSLLALLGALELSRGSEAVLDALQKLGIFKPPPPVVEESATLEDTPKE